MSQSPHNGLPPGVRLAWRDGDEPIELTVRAADANQLAWRIHDLIPLIQTGRLARLIETLAPADSPRDRPPR